MCLLFFQLALLAGYSYAHALVRYCKPRAQMLIHAGLLLLSLLCLQLRLLQSLYLAKTSV